MYKTDKIAILMATYNGEKYIGEQIASILCQSLEQWELFVHDDGSSDKTMDIVNEYARKYEDKIHVIQGFATGGAKNNFFYLLENVRAPYIMCCDQDDVWLPNKIEKTYKKMIETEKQCGSNTPIIVFTDLKVVDKDLKTISERMSKSQKLDPNRVLFKDILIQNVVTGCSMMMNSACVEKALVDFDIKKIIMHDWWLALVGAYFGKIVFVDESLILYRQHGGNSVGAKQLSSISYIKEKVKKSDSIRRTLKFTREQAYEFSMVYNLGNESLCAQYGLLENKNKTSRLFFYMKNHMWKCGFARNIGLLIFG